MATAQLRILSKALIRKKTFDCGMTQTELLRCMNLLDLTFLGVGATLGLGVYVLAGSVSKDVAGPAVVLSFLVAAIASGLAALCYAEFASRVPRAGSAYVYSYVTVGELVAFIIGWSLILEYSIGGASVARGLVAYVDSRFNYTMAQYMMQHYPLPAGLLAPFPDPISFIVLMLLGALLSAGVKGSAILNSVFTFVNITTILIVIGAGSYWIDFGNWSIPKSSIPKDANGGEGGFFPFGVSGMLSGAATCFYGFVGFDAIATTGEEAKNPARDIPLALMISLCIIFLAYFAISIVLTLMWPYYDQDKDAPLLLVFSNVGWNAVMWIVLVGAVFALWTSMLGAMFPLPRLLYSMASDGLIFSFLGRIHPRTKTPVLATVVSTIASGIMAMFFDLSQLVEMLSIGTLQAYTIVAICVLLLRYDDPKEVIQQNNNSNFDPKEVIQQNNNSNFDPKEVIQQNNNSNIDPKEVIQQNNDSNIITEPVRSNQSRLPLLDNLFNLSQIKSPNQYSTKVARIAIGVMCALSVGIAVMLANSASLSALRRGNPVAVAFMTFLAFANLMTLIVISRQPVSSAKLIFKVPLLPWLPAVSILMNMQLMCMLNRYTWFRFFIWMVLGSVNYFLFGVWNSVEGKKKHSDISLDPTCANC